ncbi:MAG: septum formation initiator family protein [Actinomycetia bacterium]|nr:septum formation initiator family protein [Actinomycetes bacterium]MCP4961231.1 septum formation initiator family protein [Actinomycetes bacterium]
MINAETGDKPSKSERGIARAIGGTAAILVVLGVVTVVLFVAVFPTSDYMAQRRELARVESELDGARAQTAELEEHLDDYNDRVSVGRIARERFSLVKEGEKLYRLSIHAGDSADLPDSWLWPGFARLVRGE